MTLPVIRAVASANKSETEFWHRVIVDHQQNDVDLETAVSLLRKAGALDATMDMARQFSQEARQALTIFPDNAWRETLQDLADFVVDRIN